MTHLVSPRKAPQRSFERLVGLCTLLVGLLSVPRHVEGQSATADEYEIRAAMLFNLTKFIEWPSWKMDATHPEFAVCILGPDPIAVELDRLLKNRMVGTKPLVVRRLNSAEAAASCHILYVSASGWKSVRRLSSTMAKNGVLTVSERSNSEIPEQVVGLPALDEHVHIDVNLLAAQQSGLTISSKVLHLATVNH